MKAVGAAILLLPLLAGGALADIIKLKSGGRLEGDIIEEGKAHVSIEILSGKVSIPREEIDSIDTDHESPLEVWNGMWPVYRDQREAEVFCFLMHWCRAQGLKAQEKMLHDRARALEPGHDFEHKAQQPKSDSRPAGENGDGELKKEIRDVGRTELREENPPEPEEPKKQKKQRPVKITVVPTWVPPLARILSDGRISYPANILAPGPANLPSRDAIDVPYWGVAPEGLSMRGNGEDLKRMQGEFSGTGLLRAIQSWQVYPRANDVLLIPPNSGSTRQWRLIYALGPKKAAMEAIDQIRSGQLQPK